MVKYLKPVDIAILGREDDYLMVVNILQKIIERGYPDERIE